jgi:predicted nucleic acid-binding protein
LRFWDTSAIGSLLVEEDASPGARALLKGDPEITVWVFARVEARSALGRRRRASDPDERIGPKELAIAERRLEAFLSYWREVDESLEVRRHAERFVAAHALRSLDALQLGAAWVACEGNPRKRDFSFVTNDGALFDAAKAEDFRAFRPAAMPPRSRRR